jgi:hypothetical protein
VFKSPPFTIKATGLDQWYEPTAKLDVKSPRWMMASETRPILKSRPVTHHANSFKRNAKNPESRATVSRFVLGKPYDILPADIGTLFEPDDEVTFNIHYFPIGEEVKDAYVEVGVWFYPEGYVPKLKTVGGPEGATFSSYRSVAGARQELVIPPHGRQVTQGMTVLQKPARIYSVPPYPALALMRDYVLALRRLLAGETERRSAAARGQEEIHAEHAVERDGGLVLADDRDVAHHDRGCGSHEGVGAGRDLETVEAEARDRRRIARDAGEWQ